MSQGEPQGEGGGWPRFGLEAGNSDYERVVAGVLVRSGKG